MRWRVFIHVLKHYIRYALTFHHLAERKEKAVRALEGQVPVCIVFQLVLEVLFSGSRQVALAVLSMWHSFSFSRIVLYLVSITLATQSQDGLSWFTPDDVPVRARKDKQPPLGVFIAVCCFRVTSCGLQLECLVGLRLGGWLDVDLVPGSNNNNNNNLACSIVVATYTTVGRGWKTIVVCSP